MKYEEAKYEEAKYKCQEDECGVVTVESFRLKVPVTGGRVVYKCPRCRGRLKRLGDEDGKGA